MGLFRNHVRWVLIAWMFVISAVAYLDRVNISIAGGLIEEQYHLSHIQLGRVFAAFVWGYAFSQAPGGRLSDRFGPRRVLLLGAIWWAIFTSLTASFPAKWAGSIYVFIDALFLLGVGAAVDSLAL